MHHLRRTAMCLVGVLLAGLLGVAGAPVAFAAQATVPGTNAPMWQTNGVVRAMAYAGGVVYVGGEFTAVRPPGSSGANAQPRNYLAAFDAATGGLITSFNPAPNGPVRALTVSPDGTRLYVGGQFTSIAGQSRGRVAAFTVANGALVGSFAPTFDGTVSALAVGQNTVYAGGSFGVLNGQGRRWLGAVAAANGARIASFAPVLDNVVYALDVSPRTGTVWVGGAFTQVNGDVGLNAAAALDPATGQARPFAAQDVIPTPSGGCTSVTKDVLVRGDSVYFANEGTGGGCFDGTFAAHDDDGSLKWVSRCLGATQGIEVIGGQLYGGSHAHDCLGDAAFDPDAFGEVGWARGLSRKLLSRSAETGALSSWYPNTNGGTGSGLGPRVMTTDGSQLFVGGEFTTVNGVAQQGLARFSPTASPVAVPAAPAAPVAVARGNGQVAVSVQAPLDLDDTDLVLRLYRGSTLIASAPVHSLFWRRPVVTFPDVGLAVGSRQTYAVEVAAADGSGTSPRVSSAAVTVTGALDGYLAAVAADAPDLQWRFGQSGGPVAADSSGGADAGTVRGGASTRADGAVPADRALVLDGVDDHVTSEQRRPSPTAYSVETWVNTTTARGGRLVGFGNSRGGGFDFGGTAEVSYFYDKHVYLRDDGRVTFGVFTGGFDLITSGAPVNDGQWHHVVATQGPAGMALYVDGVRQGRNPQPFNQAYDGYWRVGGDNLGSWPDRPASDYLAGAVDEVAVYPTVLSADAVLRHYTASGRTATVPPAPTDPYAVAVRDDDPATYWRLDETGGAVAVDSSAERADGQLAGTPGYGRPGALDAQGTALGFTGDAGASTDRLGSVGAFSTELWFSTTSTTGGKLVGFGDQRDIPSGNYDKHTYLTDDGRLVFGVWNGRADTVVSAPGLNDGRWHHVVAVQGPDGMALYVDGAVIGTNPVTTSQVDAGHWRIGGDNLAGWPDRPTSDAFTGVLDEVAIYPTALDAAAVARHFHAAPTH